TSSIYGGSTSSFVAGPLARNIGANLSTGDYIFPVGVTASYLPFTLLNVNTGAVQPVIKVEAVQTSSGGSVGSGLLSLSQTEYWVASFTGNYLNGNISIGRQSNLAPLNVIARSSSLTGQYDNLNGTVSGNSIINSDNTSTSLGYFLFAEKGCTSPSIDAMYNGEQSKVICNGELYTLTANAIGGTGCSGTWEYAWYTGNGNDVTYWNGSTWTNNETWGAFATISNVAPITTTTYKTKVRCSSNYSCTNSDITGVTVTVNSSALPSVAGVYTSSLTQIDGTTRLYADGSCNSLVLIQDPSNGSGVGLTSCSTTLTSNPIIGQNNTLNGQVYLPRNFEITSFNSEIGTITFYVSQSDFTNYNGANGSLLDLPTSGSNSDPAITNLRLAKIVNGDLTSGTFSYPTITSYWNSTNNRWEITANTDISGKYYFFTDPVCNQVVSGFSQGSIGSTTAALSWNSNPAALSYEVRIRPIGTTAWMISNGWTGLNATMTGLTPATNYEAQIKVRCNSTTSGLFSPSINFTTSVSTVCPIPTGLATNAVTSNSVNVVWNAMSNPTSSYVLRFRPQGNVNWMNAGVQGISKQLFNLTSSTTYELQISSWCPSLQTISTWSNSIFFTTAGQSCNAPANLNVSSVTTNSAILSWTNVQGALGYVARWRPVGNSIWSQGGGLNNPRFIQGLTASTSYEVQVST
ncbi:MAG TPA: fibronectin type III domain-containing protein, partial [Chitinophagaceae bacterium]|nr:fibronectin type III domain-containing protein [Chitinophagaceae bacterium]